MVANTEVRLSLAMQIRQILKFIFKIELLLFVIMVHRSMVSVVITANKKRGNFQIHKNIFSTFLKHLCTNLIVYESKQWAI